jgi:hypothetical protein
MIRTRNASGKDVLDSELEAGRGMLVRLPVHAQHCASLGQGWVICCSMKNDKGVAPVISWGPDAAWHRPRQHAVGACGAG